MSEAHNDTSVNQTSQKETSTYLPIFSSWKWAIPILIGLFLIAGISIVYTTFHNLSLHYPSSGRLYLMILHSLLAIVVFVCLCIAILKLIVVYAKNMEREREILTNLFEDEQKRLIIRIDKEKDEAKKDKDDLKKAKEIIEELEKTKKRYENNIEELKNMNEKEYEKAALIKYQKEKIEYLEKINKQIIEKGIIIK